MGSSLARLLQELSGLGVTLRMVGQNLRYHPRSVVDSRPELRVRMRTHKNAFLNPSPGDRIMVTRFLSRPKTPSEPAPSGDRLQDGDTFHVCDHEIKFTFS